MSQPPSEGLIAARQQIDALDEQLLDLLARRQELVRLAGVFKPKDNAEAVRAPERFEQVIATRRAGAAARGLEPAVAEAVWRAMIGAFIEYELRVNQEEGLTTDQ